MILLDRLGLEDVLLPLISGALLLTGALVLYRALMQPRRGRARQRRAARPGTSRRDRRSAPASASCSGSTTAGSGTLIAIGLILGFRLAPRRVVGTDVFHAAVLLWVAAIAHLFSGNVDLTPDRRRS